MKLVLAVVVALCLGYAAAEGGCDPLQRFKIKHQWHDAFGTGHKRLEFAVKVFGRLFRDHPEVRSQFADVHSENILSVEFEAYAERALASLDVNIGLLDDQEALTANLAWVKAHSRHLKAEHYQFIGEEIVRLLPEKLGTHVDVPAWKDCLTLIVNGLK